MVASSEGCSGCAISGSALAGIFCDQPFRLSLTVTDCFSNSRSAPGGRSSARAVQHEPAAKPLELGQIRKAYQG